MQEFHLSLASLHLLSSHTRTVRCTSMARISEAGRSRIMSAIRSRNTRPEIRLRKTLWSMGLGGYRLNSRLPGHPDILYTRYKLAVFIDGCFWHGCPEHYTIPEQNTAYWVAKIERTRQRDRQADEELAHQGYDVIRVWEHDIRSDVDAVARTIGDRLAVKGRPSKCADLRPPR